MGVELVLLWLGVAIAGGFMVDKGVELTKHAYSVKADKYEACVKERENIKDCRELQ